MDAQAAHHQNRPGRQNPQDSKSTNGSDDVPTLEKLYHDYRRYAFAVAYRMLGTVTDAEDIVQDCFIELKTRSLTEVRDFKAYIAKMIVNRSINRLNSARMQRETYVGAWLPEPLGEAVDSPEVLTERKDQLSYAFMVLLEQLRPEERAVFVLREAFQYPYKDIAETLDMTESNCRQLYSRSRRRLQSGTGTGEHMDSVEKTGSTAAKVPHTEFLKSARSMTAPSDQVDRNRVDQGRAALLDRFTAAFMAYDIHAMLELLAEKPMLISDGGGKVFTVARPMHGQKGVLALLTSRKVFTSLRDLKLAPTIMNGELHLALLEAGKVIGAICLKLTPDQAHIEQLYVMLNPDKLRTVQYPVPHQP
ncbi:sigma-70 family RNA polymerase sigma factor [Paenibacillus massiliensis]|uniref:sigma-70 family RNA polymerase sigma factor n=1 Tax=Paenibacillus massiliensis TaxID=225917 RepID=UPI000472B2A3|nr:sigma-70 family RNA polymerase sigma factor [Paenibacillus massiliensis]